MSKKNDIQLLRINYLRGPNIWTYRPVIEAWVDIGDLEADRPPGIAVLERRSGVFVVQDEKGARLLAGSGKHLFDQIWKLDRADVPQAEIGRAHV